MGQHKSAPPVVQSQCFSCIDPHSESVQVYTFQKGQVKAANKRYDSAVAGGFIGCTSSKRYVDGMT